MSVRTAVCHSYCAIGSRLVSSSLLFSGEIECFSETDSIRQATNYSMSFCIYGVKPRSFEEEVQMRTRDIIDEYRRIARKAQEDTSPAAARFFFVAHVLLIARRL